MLPQPSPRLHRVGREEPQLHGMVEREPERRQRRRDRRVRQTSTRRVLRIPEVRDETAQGQLREVLGRDREGPEGGQEMILQELPEATKRPRPHRREDRLEERPNNNGRPTATVLSTF